MINPERKRQAAARWSKKWNLPENLYDDYCVMTRKKFLEREAVEVLRADRRRKA